MPGLDMEAFVDARRKDVEALMAANKITYEALQSLAHTQSDMLTQAMQGMQATTQGMLSGSGKGVDMAGNADVARAAWQKMLDDMKSVAEMVQKAQRDAMAGLTARAQENMAAMKGLGQPK